MGLDFTHAADLFIGSEQQLALALDIAVADLRELRQNPDRAPDSLLLRLGRALIERGDAMRRVGELLLER